MIIDPKEYQLLLRSMGLDEYPKTAGCPEQYMVDGFGDLWKFYCDYIDSKSLYICHNSYPEYHVSCGKEIPTKIQINNIMNDFDSEKIENSQLDTLKTIEFLREKNIAYAIDFTAGKGFHALLRVQPTVFSLATEEDRKTLSNLIYAIQLRLKNQLGLRTMDEKVMGDIKRIMRMPYSFHRNRFGDVNGRMCVPLEYEMLKWNITKIIEFSKDPEFFIPENPGDILDLVSLCERLEIGGFDEVETERKSKFAKISNVAVTGKTATMYLDLIARQKPCISNGMKDVNPPHFIRMAFVFYLKKLGYTAEQVKQIYYDIAAEIGYIDQHNRQYGEHQIDTLFNPRYEREPGCTRIKAGGYCIGGCNICCNGWGKKRRGLCSHGKCLRFRN